MGHETLTGLYCMARIRKQALRDRHHAITLYERHQIITEPSPKNADISRGIDRFHFVGKLDDYDRSKFVKVDGIWVPRPIIKKDWKKCQWKERGIEEVTKEPFMEVEVEYIRHRNLDPSEDDYWGREWRNRDRGIDSYWLFTQDGKLRIFQWQPIWDVMEDWHSYLNKMSEPERKIVLETQWVNDWKEDGLRMLERKDNDGRRKNLLYLSWRGRHTVRDLRPIEELTLYDYENL